MPAGNWDEILSAYKSNRELLSKTTTWGKDLICMEKLFFHLLSNRDLSKFYPVTSHGSLLLSIGKTWEETLDKPFISIHMQLMNVKEEYRDKFRYEFSLSQDKKDNESWTRNVESVFCSFEKSLEVFDKMIEKLEKIS